MREKGSHLQVKGQEFLIRISTEVTVRLNRFWSTSRFVKRLIF